ncbi:MAG: transglycosylase domain-containing protein [Cytophagaceae bacterium]|jgi:penicillin-binding protein 1A|nr:transglycosylase domain-containing protein [Cytophagaceae bacterium]
MKHTISIKKVILWMYLVFAGIVALTALLFFLVSVGALGFMPTFEELENPKSFLATEIISTDNALLGSFYKENRTGVDYNQISPNVINALVATEDVRFHNHSGIDARGLGRVAVKTVFLRDKSAGGGSTITQQLAKLLFHEPAKSKFQRYMQKFKEWVIAVKLERSYTKEEILTMYLNKVPFIYDAYGIRSAASTFFNTTQDSLKIEQAATIVGMLQNPAFYNPVRRPDTTMHRRNVVLGQMLKMQVITRQEFDSLKQLPLTLDFSRRDHNQGLAGYVRQYLSVVLNAPMPDRKNYQASWLQQKFIEDSTEWADNPLYGWVRKNLKADGTPYNIYRDGLRIYTTIDSRMQQYAEAAVVEHLGKELQPQFNAEKKGKNRAPFTNRIKKEEYESIINRAIQQSDRYRAMMHSGTPVDSIMMTFKEPVNMRVFSYSGDIDTLMSPLDSILYYKSFLRASLFSMDPQSGHVKAYVGGPNFRHFKYDMATQGKRQVGSTIKPFVYTLAMQNGMAPCDMAPNIPQTFYLPEGGTWTPRNTGDARSGEMVSLKWGLAQSNNNITAWIMKQYNPETVAGMIRSLGIKSPIDPIPALCLGTADFGLSEMVAAYCAYANKGVQVEPLIVTRIEDRYGKVISTFSPRRKETISEEKAYLMLNLLEGVINTGTGMRLRGSKYNLRGQIGGKTGTTQNHSDGWFMGVTPNLVSGIWVGGEDRDIHFDNMRLGQGANMALPIWALYMTEVYNDKTIPITLDDKFEAPAHFNISLNCPDEYVPHSEDEMLLEFYYADEELY